MINRILNLDSRELFLSGARWTFGLWLLYVGLSKWVGGASGFVGYLTEQFANTWAPAGLIVVLSYLILILEPLLGVWLLLGKHERMAWIATAKLMFILMFGQTMLQNHAIVANNWQYLVLAMACAALSRPPSQQ